jgi:hypothetical protein
MVSSSTYSEWNSLKDFYLVLFFLYHMVEIIFALLCVKGFQLCNIKFNSNTKEKRTQVNVLIL